MNNGYGTHEGNKEHTDDKKINTSVFNKLDTIFTHKNV